MGASVAEDMAVTMFSHPSLGGGGKKMSEIFNR